MFILFPRARVRVSAFALPVMLLMLWCEGIAPFLIILFSALLHELGHLTAVFALGYRIRRIDILPLGALIVLPEGIPNKSNFKIAICGPLASLLSALAGWGGFVAFGGLPWLFFAVVNCVLGLFNLLPIKKLDGGKALFCKLSERLDEKTTEKISSAVSLLTALVFVGFVAICVVLSERNLGVALLGGVLAFQVLSKE